MLANKLPILTFSNKNNSAQSLFGKLSWLKGLPAVLRQLQLFEYFRVQIMPFSFGVILMHYVNTHTSKIGKHNLLDVGNALRSLVYGKIVKFENAMRKFIR